MVTTSSSSSSSPSSSSSVVESFWEKWMIPFGQDHIHKRIWVPRCQPSFSSTPPPSPNLRQTKGKSKGGGGGKDNWGLVHIWPNKFETEHDFLSSVILNNYTYVNPKRAFQALSGRHYSLYFFSKCARQRIPPVIVAFLNSSGVEWMLKHFVRFLARTKTFCCISDQKQRFKIYPAHDWQAK